MVGNKANILGIAINSSSAISLLNTIVKQACRGVIARPSKPDEATPSNDSIVVFTPNPEFIVEAQKDPEFKKWLNKADINLPDGVGLVIAGRLLGQPISERVSGADMVEELLEVLNERWPASPRFASRSRGGIIGIAGARRGERSEADILIKRLAEKYPNIKFVNLDVGNEKWEAGNEVRSEKFLESNISPRYPASHFHLHTSNNGFKISNFNLVLACHGMKKQEQWIMENKDRLEANVFMGVGGSLDFLTGFSRRAPRIMRGLGLEWLWRGVQKPRHFLRVWKAVFVFNWLLLKEIVKNR